MCLFSFSELSVFLSILNMSSTLVVIGSGPQIGSSTASLFAARKFAKVALISRDGVRIEQERKAILDLLPSGRSVEVNTWSVDITETKKFEKVLHEVENLGDISCVLFNAARVAPSEMFEFEEAEIIKDCMVCHPLVTSVCVSEF